MLSESDNHQVIFAIGDTVTIVVEWSDENEEDTVTVEVITNIDEASYTFDVDTVLNTATFVWTPIEDTSRTTGEIPSLQ